MRVLLPTLVAAIIALVGFRLLTGGIATSGLLENRLGDGISPERVQLLAVTIAVLSAYVSEALQAAGRAGFRLDRLPDVSTALVLVMGGSQAMFLVGKVARTIGRGAGGTDGR